MGCLPFTLASIKHCFIWNVKADVLSVHTCTDTESNRAKVKEQLQALQAECDRATKMVSRAEPQVRQVLWIVQYRVMTIDSERRPKRHWQRLAVPEWIRSAWSREALSTQHLKLARRGYRRFPLARRGTGVAVNGKALSKRHSDWLSFWLL